MFDDRSARLRSLLAIFVACGVAMAACSSEDNTGDLLPPIEEPVSSELTSEPVDTTSTSSSTSTSTPITALASDLAGIDFPYGITLKPTTANTTPDGKPIIEIPTEWDGPAEEIIGRYLLYREAISTIFYPPQATPDYPPLKELTTDGLYKIINERAHERLAEGRISYEPDQILTDYSPSFFSYLSTEGLEATEGNKILVTDCIVDATVAASGDGRIINDLILGVLNDVTMQVVDGEWRVAAVVAVDPQSRRSQECQDDIKQLDLPESYSEFSSS